MRSKRKNIHLMNMNVSFDYYKDKDKGIIGILNIPTY